MRKRVLWLGVGVIAALALLYVGKSQVSPTVAPVGRVLGDFTEMRIGPDQNFFVKSYLYHDQQYPIIGRDETDGWWQMEVDGTPGWVKKDYIAAANVENVPVIETTPCVNEMSPTCPVSRKTTEVTMQTFEHGMMLQLHDSHYIDWLGNDGEFDSYKDDWNGQPLRPETPPTGLLQPAGSFGYLWLTYPKPDSFGWATAETVTYTTALEIAEGTTYAPSDDVTYMRLPDGRVIGLNSYGHTWFFL